MSSTTRYDAGSAMARTRATVTGATGAPAARARSGTPATEGNYVLLSVWQIKPAPWQPRRVFEHLEEMAATIEGDAETEGVGVLEPVLVRRCDDGSGYELIDGERRLRACRLIAERSPSRDYLLPARIFTVSERVARLMGQTANIERDEPKPYEVALGYQRIREALRAEVGDEATSARALAGLGRHGKTQVADYLAIADALTPEVLTAAGLVAPDGETQFDLLARMTKKELHAAARMSARSADACAAALKVRVDRLLGVAPSRREDAAPVPTPEERRAQLATGAAFSLRVPKPAQKLDPDVARALVEHELTPAMLALVERAHGGAVDSGFYASTSDSHTMIVVPAAVEALTDAQLERLQERLTHLRSRADRARRGRRRTTRGASERPA